MNRSVRLQAGKRERTSLLAGLYTNFRAGKAWSHGVPTWQPVLHVGHTCDFASPEIRQIPFIPYKL